MAAYIKFVNPNKNNINNDNIALQDAILPDITGANAEYVINPQGVSDEVVTNTGNNIFDYIVRYKISDLIKNTN